MKEKTCFSTVRSLVLFFLACAVCIIEKMELKTTILDTQLCTFRIIEC